MAFVARLNVRSAEGAAVSNNNGINPPAAPECGVGSVMVQRRRGLCRALGETMKLIEAVQQLPRLDGVLTIYARQPWAPSADAQLAFEGSEEEKKLKSEGRHYFLEVFIARDLLEDWRASKKNAPTDEQSCLRLIKYATNDA